MRDQRKEELITKLIHISDSACAPCARRKFPPTYDKRTIRKYGALADFILSREAKIVEPLVTLGDMSYQNWDNNRKSTEELIDAIDQTLKNASQL